MLARFFYTLIMYLFTPFMLLRLKLKSRKNPDYFKRIKERFGQYDQIVDAGSIWVHTVSVGEFQAAKPLIDGLLRQYPKFNFIVTTTTPTGAEQVMRAYQDLIEAKRVTHLYLPFDTPFGMKSFIKKFAPRVCIVMETELWPNMIHYTHQYNIPIVLANARLSEKSANGYHKFLPLVRPMMRQISMVAVQTQVEANRFMSLGLPPKSVQVTGSIKFDLEPPADLESKVATIQSRWDQRPVLIVASSHEGEEELIFKSLPTLQDNIHDLLLVVVPRHKERFDQVASLLTEYKLPFQKHSLAEQILPDTKVVLGDTMGELIYLLAASDVCFMGGSLVPVGGHNVIEPLAVGTPTMIGPHVFNFSKICRELIKAELLYSVSSPVGLAQVAQDLFSDDDKRSRLSKDGKAFVEDNKGALVKLVGLLVHYIDMSMQSFDKS